MATREPFGRDLSDMFNQWRTQDFSMGVSVTSHRDDVSFSDVTAIIMP